MREADLDELPLDEIMTRWPQVLRVFIDWHLHCIGCPIAGFHTLADSAKAHGNSVEELRAAILAAINDPPAAPGAGGPMLPSAAAHTGP